MEHSTKYRKAAEVLRKEADKARNPAKAREARQHQTGLELLAKVAERKEKSTTS